MQQTFAACGEVDMGKVTYVDENFYYNCGLVFARKLGIKPPEVQERYVSDFKRFVDMAGGPDSFSSVEEATFKFFTQKKRNFYGK